MNNSIDAVNKDIRLLRLEIQELIKRLIVAEVQLDVLAKDYKFKKQIWAVFRQQLAALGWMLAGVALVLIIIKSHI